MKIASFKNNLKKNILVILQVKKIINKIQQNMNIKIFKNFEM